MSGFMGPVKGEQSILRRRVTGELPSPDNHRAGLFYVIPCPRNNRFNGNRWFLVASDTKMQWVCRSFLATVGRYQVYKREQV